MQDECRCRCRGREVEELAVAWCGLLAAREAEEGRAGQDGGRGMGDGSWFCLGLRLGLDGSSLSFGDLVASTGSWLDGR